jgi:hypothetical protein
MRLPDFIIVGAMKAATSTLHEQLAAQHGVVMSDPKEPNFFSDDAQFARGIEWYGSLFADGPADALRGESSTHYTKRPTHPRTIDRMRAVLPRSTRFVYVMRHPIDRLVSHYVHEWTQNVIRTDIERAVLDHPELVEYSRYASQMEPYWSEFGPEAVLPVFFERLRSNPQAELDRIASHIGLRTAVHWRDDVDPRNVSSERLRRSALRDAIVNAPGMAALRRTLVPRSLRDRVKAMWMMKERPRLADSTVARLEAVFDAELERLSPWTGIRCTCRTYLDRVCAEAEKQSHRHARDHAA